jgi:hypothetical protein
MKTRLLALAAGPSGAGGLKQAADKLVGHLKAVHEAVTNCKPATLCPDLQLDHTDCRECGGSYFMSKFQVAERERELAEAKKAADESLS